MLTLEKMMSFLDPISQLFKKKNPLPTQQVSSAFLGRSMGGTYSPYGDYEIAQRERKKKKVVASIVPDVVSSMRG